MEINSYEPNLVMLASLLLYQDSNPRTKDYESSVQVLLVTAKKTGFRSSYHPHHKLLLMSGAMMLPGSAPPLPARGLYYKTVY
jgi:hypothetical protein